MFADARRHSCATECAPDDPRFERAEAATELNTIIHIVDLGAGGIAQVQVFGSEGEETAQTLDVTHIKRAEIERNKKHFVRIDHERIRLSPAVSHPFVF